MRYTLVIQLYATPTQSTLDVFHPKDIIQTTHSSTIAIAIVIANPTLFGIYFTSSLRVGWPDASPIARASSQQGICSSLVIGKLYPYTRIASSLTRLRVACWRNKFCAARIYTWITFPTYVKSKWFLPFPIWNLRFPVAEQFFRRMILLDRDCFL